jgi:predicted Zn-dependent protease
VIICNVASILNKITKLIIKIYLSSLEINKIINAILEIPQEQRDYELVGILARAYNNNNEYAKAIDQLLSVKKQGENDASWNFRLAYAYFYLNETPMTKFDTRANDYNFVRKLKSYGKHSRI